MPPKHDVSAILDIEPASDGREDAGRVAVEANPPVKRGKPPTKRASKATTPKPARTRQPAATAPVVAAASAEHPSAVWDRVPPIIVATADASLARMLSFALDQMRLQYRLIDSGSLALRELLDMSVGSQRPLIVLDVDLPGVDGHAILERIGVDRPDTFLILVLSSHADESVQVRSLLAGALDHLAKPFNVRVLMAKIQRWVAISAHLPGAA